MKRIIEIEESDLERIREIVERENKTALSVTTRGTAYITIADSKPYDDSGDCISREYVEGIVEELENICQNAPEEVIELLSKVKNAPPVFAYTDDDICQATVDGYDVAKRQFERPQGEWIDERNDGGGCVAICSNCKTLEVTGRFCRTCGSDNTQSFLKSFKCGADMKGGAE